MGRRIQRPLFATISRRRSACRSTPRISISGASTRRTLTRRVIRRSRRSTQSNVGRLRVVWRHKQADPAILAANPDFNLSNRYMVTPIYVGGMLYVPNGFGLAEAVDPKTGATLWTQKPLIEGPEGLPSLMISKGVAHWGRGDDARILHVRQQHLFALNPKTGSARSELRRRRCRRSLDGRVPLQVERRAGRCRRRRRRRLVDARAGLRRLQGRTPRLRARVRRAHRQGALVVEPRAARRRSRDVDVAGRSVAVHGRRQRLVDVQRRRRARPGLRADVGCHERHVRRPPARQQPLRQLDRRVECADRRARLAFPNRASRSLRLRLAGRADLDRHHGRRPDDQGAGASHEARRSCSCSIARRASPCGRSRSGPCRSRPCRAKSRRRRSRIRRSRRRSSSKGSPRTTSSTSRRSCAPKPSRS